jgi:hypothetical protein
MAKKRYACVQQDGAARGLAGEVLASWDSGVSPPARAAQLRGRLTWAASLCAGGAVPGHVP